MAGRDDNNLPEAVPSNLPQSYNYDHDLPQVVEPTPEKWRHPQFSTGSYTPSPPLTPPLEREVLGLRRTTFFLSLALAVLVIFGVALGAGLGVGLKKSNVNSVDNKPSGVDSSLTTTSLSSSSLPATTSSPASSTSSECNPSQTPAITNGNFEAGNESWEISPWFIRDLTAPATYEVLNINGSDVFHAICKNDLEHGAYTKIKLAQELATCPNTTYDLSFRHNFIPGDNPNAWLVIFINGVEISSIRAASDSWVTFRGNFTSGTGNSTLQLDFTPVAYDSQEFFVDDFKVTPRE
ncbi:hypothetical protein H072_11318 [Dactylellina haptotyla CBS 200.50]|uniref:Uncharacterized protein n=1 Tax=Dactylellina haptotyla (strain CBS 200.50) TaxID=1284197 RepID=S7ZXA7_DACHA|nr:hypothetical protein H072_11318 [Dactylellina haptotyla CBS 200.50]